MLALQVIPQVLHKSRELQAVHDAGLDDLMGQDVLLSSGGGVAWELRAPMFLWGTS